MKHYFSIELLMGSVKEYDVIRSYDFFKGCFGKNAFISGGNLIIIIYIDLNNF